MSFRISSHKNSGQRIKSLLIDGQSAQIGADDSCEFQFDLPEGATVTISEENGSLSICSKNIEVSVKNKSLKDTAMVIGTSAHFSIGEQEFYTTVVLSGKPTPRKKSYLSSIALTLIWSLLVIMLVIPIWLPYKIKIHHVRGKNVLLENCASDIDTLRKKIKDDRKELSEISQVHRDIMVRINEEVEQIAWVFRNSGEFMTKEELEKLEKDVASYLAILKKVKKTQTVNVKPLSTDEAVKQLLKTDK